MIQFFELLSECPNSHGDLSSEIVFNAVGVDNSIPLLKANKWNPPDAKCFETIIRVLYLPSSSETVNKALSLSKEFLLIANIRYLETS